MKFTKMNDRRVLDAFFRLGACLFIGKCLNICGGGLMSGMFLCRDVGVSTCAYVCACVGMRLSGYECVRLPVCEPVYLYVYVYECVYVFV